MFSILFQCVSYSIFSFSPSPVPPDPFYLPSHPTLSSLSLSLFQNNSTKQKSRQIRRQKVPKQNKPEPKVHQKKHGVFFVLINYSQAWSLHWNVVGILFKFLKQTHCYAKRREDIYIQNNLQTTMQILYQTIV